MQRGEGLDDVKFGTFTGRFPSDGAASMAVKGLIEAFRTSLCMQALT